MKILKDEWFKTASLRLFSEATSADDLWNFGMEEALSVFKSNVQK